MRPVTGLDSLTLGASRRVTLATGEPGRNPFPDFQVLVAQIRTFSRLPPSQLLSLKNAGKNLHESLMNETLNLFIRFYVSTWSRHEIAFVKVLLHL